MRRRERRLVAFLNSFVKGMSGGDLRFIEVVRRLKGFEVVVITSLLGKEACKERGLRANYYLTTKEREIISIYLLYPLRIFRLLFLKIKVEEGDILYSTSDFLPDVLPPFLYKLRDRKRKWIACLHLILPSLFVNVFTKRRGIPNLRYALYYLEQRLSICLMKFLADQIFVVNRLDKKFLISHFHILKDKISVVKNGIDFSKIGKVKADKVKYDASFIGRFHPQKGIFDLVDIWDIVSQKKRDAKLVIIGSGRGKYAEQIKKEIEKRSNILWVGFKNGEEKIRILKESKIFLFPSHYESFGMVIAEAMASGLPVVAYSLPIYREIFKKGLVVAPLGDKRRMADYILKLLNEPELRERIGKEGEEFIRRYNWDIVAAEEKEILEKI